MEFHIRYGIPYHFPTCCWRLFGRRSGRTQWHSTMSQVLTAAGRRRMSVMILYVFVYVFVCVLACFCMILYVFYMFLYVFVYDFVCFCICFCMFFICYMFLYMFFSRGSTILYDLYMMCFDLYMIRIVLLCFVICIYVYTGFMYFLHCSLFGVDAPVYFSYGFPMEFHIIYGVPYDIWNSI